MVKTLNNKDQLFCSQGDTSAKHEPKKFFKSAKGNFLVDYEGKKYLDMQMFNSAANFGYQNPTYEQCIISSIQSLPCLAAEFMNESRVLLSEKICNYMYSKFGAKGRVHFTVGGAQAVDDALKLAFNYTQNQGVICFEGAYHGRTMASSSVSSSYRYTKQFGSVIDTYTIPFPNCAVCAYDKTDCTSNELYCIERINRLFSSEFLGVFDTNTQKSRYRTFLFEPVLGRGGYVFPQNDYYKNIFKIFKSHDIVTIADEVQMGFYRTGKMWCFEHYDICPDIIVFGKAISNGLWPLAGIWAKEEIISPQLWTQGSTHCTFAGHPLGTTIGLQTFNILENKTEIQKIQKSSNYFAQIIRNLQEDFPNITRAQIKGHAAGLDIVDPKTKKPTPQGVHTLIENALGETFHYKNEDYGLILTAGGLHNSSLMLSPSVYISEEELDLFNRLFHRYMHQTFNT